MTAEALASWMVRVAGAYFAAGLAFAVFFLIRGIERIDPAARGSGRGFRWILLPGVIALWPVLARRWVAGGAAAGGTAAEGRATGGGAET